MVISSSTSETGGSSGYNFPDGDISLLVESTSFRVHKAKLVRHSHVFDDMFIVAHPDSDDEEEEDSRPARQVYPAPTPVRDVSVRMPDTVEEWRLVFGVLYPRKDRPSSIASIRDIALALRMAEKYDVADVHSWAVAHFAHRFPPSLSYLSSTDTMLETACFALNLAHMYDVRSVLPSIYFALATTEWYLTPDELSERLSRWLDKADVERVLAGRSVLWKRTLIVRHEAEPNHSSPMLEPYCATPGPSEHVTGNYSRAAKSCRDILSGRLREALGMSSSDAGRRNGVRGVKGAPGRTLLDALQILEEMDDMDIVVWPSPVCHVCSLVHSRWVAQTQARTIRDMLEAFQE